MAVPKRKTSKSRRDSRSANKGIKAKAFTYCSNCETPIMPHQACMHCGFYKGVKVFATKLDRTEKRQEMKKAKKDNKISNESPQDVDAISAEPKN